MLNVSCRPYYLLHLVFSPISHEDKIWGYMSLLCPQHDMSKVSSNHRVLVKREFVQSGQFLYKERVADAAVNASFCSYFFPFHMECDTSVKKLVTRAFEKA